MTDEWTNPFRGDGSKAYGGTVDTTEATGGDLDDDPGVPDRDPGDSELDD